MEREYYSLASDGLLEKYDKYFTGGMSEAAKRRIEAELESEFEMLDPSDHMDPVEAALEEKHLQDLVEQAAGGNVGAVLLWGKLVRHRCHTLDPEAVSTSAWWSLMARQMTLGEKLYATSQRSNPMR